MANPTLQDVFDAARGYLHDTQVNGGEVFTNTALQQSFNQPYREMFSRLMGVSKRVQRITYVNLPPLTTILIPSAYAINDFDEPEVIEERPAQNAIAIATTSNATPIVVATVSPHGLGSSGTQVEGTISGVSGTSGPLGLWFATIIDATSFSLNGSVTDGTAGTGGSFVPQSQQQYVEVLPIDLAEEGIDGLPGQYLGVYLWNSERLQFRGATGTQQLRITYWASGSPPTNANTVINIDNCIDFLACATAGNAARGVGWYQLADQLKEQAYGSPDAGQAAGGLLGQFVAIQVSTMQRGPQRRRAPFRPKRSRYGSYLIS